MYFSGLKAYSVRFGPLGLNLSPANLMLVFTIIYLWRAEYLQFSSSSSFFNRLYRAFLGLVWSPGWLRLPLALGVLLFSSTLLGLTKSDENTAIAKFLTGVAGLATFLVVLKTIDTWRDFVVFVRLFVVLVSVAAVLSLLAGLGVISAAEWPFFFPGQDPLQIQEISLPFSKAATFGFADETLNAFLLIALAVLFAAVARRDRTAGALFPLWAAVSLAALIGLSVLAIQSRGNWLVLVPLSMLLVGVHIVDRFRPVVRRATLLLLISIPIAFLVYVWVELGPPRSSDEITDYLLSGQRPHLFGQELPRTFFKNAMQRMLYFESAWNWTTEHPFSGAPRDEYGDFQGHSAYADLMALAGAVPLVLLAGFVFSLFRTSGRELIQAESNMRNSLGVALYGLLLTSLFFFGFFQKQFFITAALLLLASGRLADMPASKPILYDASEEEVGP